MAISPGTRIAIRTLLSYLMAGAACVVYERWPHFTGHAHIPFSGFPEYFVLAPVAPYFLLTGALAGNRSDALGVLLFAVVFAAAMWFMVGRGNGARKG